MWKANIESIEYSSDNPTIALVRINYSNSDGRSKGPIVEKISDPNLINYTVTNGINELERIDSINALVANPILGDVVLKIPETESQLKIDSYNEKRQQLISFKQDLDLGIINQNTYNLALAEVIKLK